MNVFDVLKQDHERVRQLFSKLEETSNRAGKTRERLFQQLKEELIAHAHAEEKVFYPTVKNKGDQEVKDEIAEGVGEHHQVEKMLKKAEKLDSSSDEWLEAIQQIKQMVEHHVQEEESEIFEAAQKLLEDGQINELGDKIKMTEQQEKKKLH